jgi:hypothetical protein
MKIVKMYRNGKILFVLEVSKKDLLELKEKYSYISVSEADMKNLENHNDNDIVGVISGDIQNIDNISKEMMWETRENPDCWFVYQPEKHGYKKLDKDFRCDFGDAIRLLKAGFKVAREDWNGKGMWLIYVPGSYCEECREGSPYKNAGLDSVNIDGHIDMHITKDTIQPGWLASQVDMLSEDWCVVE